MADPLLFFALPEGVQRAHLEHTRNHIIGRYTPAPPSAADPSRGATADPRMLNEIGRWRAGSGKAEPRRR